jgi:hypothetical protein
MNEDVDAARVRDCLGGNQQAFAALVEQYEKPIYNIALRMLRNSEDARDIAQSVFLKAYQNLSSYDPQYKFYSWIYRMAINESCGCRAAVPGPSTTSCPRMVMVRPNYWPRARDATRCFRQLTGSSQSTGP